MMKKKPQSSNPPSHLGLQQRRPPRAVADSPETVLSTPGPPEFTAWLQDLQSQDSESAVSSSMKPPRRQPDSFANPPPPPVSVSLTSRWLHNEHALNTLVEGLKNSALEPEDVCNVLDGELRLAGDGLLGDAVFGLSDASDADTSLNPCRDWAIADPLSEPFDNTSKAIEASSVARLMEVEAARRHSSRLSPRASEYVTPCSGVNTLRERSRAKDMVSRPRALAASVGDSSQPARSLECSNPWSCERCLSLESSLVMMAQALAGLGATAFNWSAANCEECDARQEHWLDILKYTQPFAKLDARIAAMCTGLRNATGIDFCDEIGTCSKRDKRAEKPMVEPVQASSVDNHAEEQDVVQAETRTLRETSQNQSTGSAPAWIGRLADDHDTILETRVWEIDSNSGSSRGRRPRFAEVTVRFQASHAAVRLSGVYARVSGPKVNGRPVYSRGSKYLLYLDDATWVIKDGPSSAATSSVYAYVEDSALEPYRVSKLWNVLADAVDESSPTGFIKDEQGVVFGGRRDTELVERLHAKMMEIPREDSKPEASFMA